MDISWHRTDLKGQEMFLLTCPKFSHTGLWPQTPNTYTDPSSTCGFVLISVCLYVIKWRRCEIVWYAAEESCSSEAGWKWFVCGWIIEQILISALRGQWLSSRTSVQTPFSLCLCIYTYVCGYLVFKHKFNWGL